MKNLTQHQIQRNSMGIIFPQITSGNTVIPERRVQLKNLTDLQLEQVSYYPESFLNGYQRHQWTKAVQQEQIYRKRKMITLFSIISKHNSMAQFFTQVFQQDLDNYIQRKAGVQIKRKSFYEKIN